MAILIFHTSWGWVGIVGGSNGIRRVTLPLPRRQAVEELLSRTVSGSSVNDNAADGISIHLKDTVRRMCCYFRGEKVRFPETLDYTDITPWRRAVYEVTRKIPYGETLSYGWVARAAGNPNAARAVGQCMARNPFPIIVPCHRVIGSSGQLTGFVGGLMMKARMLQLEGVRASETGRQVLRAAPGYR